MLKPEVKADKAPAVVPRDPFDRRLFGRDLPLMRKFSHEMDRLFEEFGFKPRFFDRAMTEFDWSPDLEVLDQDGRFVVKADLPGLKKEDVKVNVEEGMLVIEGERKEDVETKKEGLYRTERTYGSFYRSLPLPEGAKLDKITANFKDGVLEIVMPVEKAEKTAKAIPVNVA